MQIAVVPALVLLEKLAEATSLQARYIYRCTAVMVFAIAKAEELLVKTEHTNPISVRL
jgi:hypothetical protein